VVYPSGTPAVDARCPHADGRWLDEGSTYVRVPPLDIDKVHIMGSQRQ